MSDHESFLKLIGLDQDPELGKETKESAPKGESAPERGETWTAYMPEDSAHNETTAQEVKGEESNSGTEWDLPKTETTETLTEAEMSAVVEATEKNRQTLNEFLNDTKSADAWPEEPEAAESFESQATPVGEAKGSWAVPEVIEKTESYREGETPHSTFVYTKAEKSKMQRSTRTSSKAITLTHGFTGGGTRPTQAIDDPNAVTGAHTAHFDYSGQGGDHRIVLLDGKASAQAFHLGNLPLRLGRDTANEAILDDVNSSRFHAEIRDLNGEFQVVDLGSTNGVKVNGEIVSERILRAHDIVQVGDCLFEFLPPGILSKGSPQMAAMSDGAALSTQPRARSRRRLVILSVIALFIIFIGFVFFVAVAPSLVENAKDAAVQEVEAELSNMREQLEMSFGKPLGEIPDEDVKKAFLNRIKASGLENLIPNGVRVEVAHLPTPVLRLFILDPNLLRELFAEGASESAATLLIKRHAADYVGKSQWMPALQYVEALLSLRPGDVEITDARDKLLAKVEKMQDAGDSGFSAAERKFYEFMEQNENRLMIMIDEKKFEEALKFSQLIARNLGDLIKAEPTFAKVAEPERQKWEDRLASYEGRIKERVEKLRVDDSRNVEGDQLLTKAKEALNFGDVAEARSKLNEFLKNHPEHPDHAEAEDLKSQIVGMLDKSYTATKSKVESLVESESYENAWKEVYRFSDVMPEDARAKELTEIVSKKAEPRAAQFYNQARVFEYEADDLVAAEQYYKRALEAADPRGELSKKAQNRYAEVKRRGIQ